ncbi:Glycosyltransferase involved in cell wall bisynthesis [Prosthecobacter debontii]|uniref:Glycosyltransferase involved in cell wall bisynthesis n=2 Tax=Prosthecobacter debontii TaxID=48467 RepID=A0A1T4XSF5_9BACT|nr:Glycosyltransferase involved in cell wall bisynthesis [Prosthecobacter debontii]
MCVHTAQTSLAPEPETQLDSITIHRSEIKPRPAALMSPGELDENITQAALSLWESKGDYPHTVIVFGFTWKLARYYWLFKKRGIRLILALTIFPEFEENLPRWFGKLKWQMRTILLTQLFDGLTVYSSAFVRLYRGLGISSRKLHIIPFPVDDGRFRPAEDDEKRLLRKTLGFGDLDGPIIVFMGSVISRKGADLLLAAWLLIEKNYPTATLIFVGPYGPRETHLTASLRREQEHFQRGFQGLLDQLSTPQSVRITGAVDNPEDYFRMADIFAFPSRLEGLGGVIPEAMACGLPCVLTRFEGFPETEFGKPGEHFLEADFTPKSIAKAIQTLLDSSSERARVGENGRSNALRVFGLPHVAQKLAYLCRPT